jgi:NDP-sugar pyrophosphorylase family protein
VLQVADKYLSSFQEKPSLPYLVSMGIYCVSRRALDFIPRDKLFGFDQLMLDLLAKRQRVRVETHPGYWLDIGRPDDYHKAIEDWPVFSAQMGL